MQGRIGYQPYGLMGHRMEIKFFYYYYSGTPLYGHPLNTDTRI